MHTAISSVIHLLIVWGNKPFSTRIDFSILELRNRKRKFVKGELPSLCWLMGSQ